MSPNKMWNERIGEPGHTYSYVPNNIQANRSVLDYVRKALKDDKLKNDVEAIREIEERMRNLAAHEIVTITDDNVPTYLGKGVTISGIYSDLQYLTQMALKVKKENWSSYDEMNRMICDKLLLAY